MLKFEGVLWCIAWLIEGGSFRASHFGVRRCFWALGAGGWLLKFTVVLRCVVRLTAWREAPLGRRVSVCVLASRVWGLGCVY